MGSMKGLGNEGLDITKLTDADQKYTLVELIGTGVYSEVHIATDNESGKRVAIKIIKYNPDIKMEVEEEYKILRDLSDHPNLPDFYGVYLKRSNSPTQQDQIWFVLQLCEGGTVSDFVKGLIDKNRRISELHIAYIVRELIKALCHLHEHHVLHRDVKGSNVLLTKNGEVKLVDFGISREVGSTLGKCHSSLGTPSYMAPEVVMSATEKQPYDNRADVWALGITAIELGDGASPYQDMHPTRALFQIVRNPPPGLYRPANWSQEFNDFIAECLVKNPEHRPFMNELIEHPFLTQLPENDYHLSLELKALLEKIDPPKLEDKKPEFKVKTGKLKRKEGDTPEMMFLEDLAALEVVTEDSILKNLEHRFINKHIYSFIGDVLVFLNPHKNLDIYSTKFQNKYKYKSRSDNEPHIFGVADAAYQDMLHHQADQHIILSGETMSGKTSQYKMILKQLAYLGQNKVGDRVIKAHEVLQAFGNAATPSNGDSTRHILFTQVTYSNSGNTSGAIFWLYQLEKTRVTQRSIQHANFHIFYYLYDSLVKAGTLELYKLEPNRKYKYLRRESTPEGSIKGPREDTAGNSEKLDKIVDNLTALEFEAEESNTIWRVLAAILILGELEYEVGDDGYASIKNTDQVDKIAELLEIENKKLGWALVNYCVVENDSVSRRKLSLPAANKARAALVRNLYSRLVDWIVNSINQKLVVTRVMFGDKYCVSILDYFGFECFSKNSLEQLFVNSFNEQIQYYYNQKIFMSEMMDHAAEEIEGCKFQFHDNKSTLDELMNKPEGVIYLLDEAEKKRLDYEFAMEGLNKKDSSNRVEAVNEHSLTVAHYTGKVSYDATAMVQKNKDFLPPELTETMRSSKNKAVKIMFTQRLSKSGNVTVKVEAPPQKLNKPKAKWGSALLNEGGKTIRRHNTISRGEYSQTRAARPWGSTYKSTCVEIMRNLSEGSAHFVRCVRTSLGQGFQPALVRQQIRALSLIDTANARKNGYSYRVAFNEFLKRYKFLAFEFDETVDETQDNCRLLLVRLKLEGYVMGKNKIFLKYYNQEYLSRLYETQVKKIIKVQSMLRAFLAKRNITRQKASRANSTETEIVPKVKITPVLNEDEAALVIQKNMKGYVARKKYGPLLTNSGKLDKSTASFIGEYARRWRYKSMFQVLVWYRTAKHMDMVYFFQQVHLYNVNLLGSIKHKDLGKAVLDKVKTNVDIKGFIGEVMPQAWRIPLSMKDLPFWDSSNLCTKYNEASGSFIPGSDTWDAPFRSNYYKPGSNSPLRTNVSQARRENVSKFIETPYCRDPSRTERFYANQPCIELDAVTPKKRAPSRSNEAGPSGYSGSPVRSQNSPVKPSPRKSQAPQPPHNYVPVYNTGPTQFAKPQQAPRDIVRSSPTKSSTTTSIDFRKNLRKPEGPDPIKELKQKGKTSGGSSDENENDEPPFNFQAMLRKTNYTRDSLKRSDSNNDNDSTVVYQIKNKRNPEPTIKERNEDNYNNNRSFQDDKTKEMRSKFKRQSSIEAIKAMMIKQPSVDANMNPKEKETVANGNVNVKEKVELAPGVMLYGDCAEL